MITKIILERPLKQEAFESMESVLSDNDKAFASEFFAIAVKYDLKPDMQYKPTQQAWKCVFYFRKPKKKIFTVWTAPDKFTVKANLYNINAYLCEYSLSQAMKQQLLAPYDCAHCKNCIGGVEFTLDRQDYKKCIFGAFGFNDLSAEEYHTVAEMIEREIMLLLG